MKKNFSALEVGAFKSKLT